MTTSEIIVTAAVAITPIIAVIVAIIVARRGKDSDIKDDAKELGQMQSDLGYIKSGIDDLKTAQIRHDKKLDDLSQRVTKVETSLDQHLNDKNIHNFARKKQNSNK